MLLTSTNTNLVIDSHQWHRHLAVFRHRGLGGGRGGALGPLPAAIFAVFFDRRVRCDAKGHAREKSRKKSRKKIQLSGSRSVP